MSKLKITPLYSIYEEWGGKTIDFNGWELPIQFSSIKAEHEAVRKKAGLFDVSHMGKIHVYGPGSFLFLQKMLTNDISKIQIGKAQYSLLCNENGGVIDDLIVYQLQEDDYLLVVNAANTNKDYEWLKNNQSQDIEIINVSDTFAQLALQGPHSEQILQKLVNSEILSELTSFRFIQDIKISNMKVLLSRTGYTGEDGFEIYCHPEDAVTIWNDILAAGRNKGIVPCGLGARDTLRFEAAFPLYGQELSENISPIEAGLTFAVKINKDTNFIGKEVLKNQIENGTSRKLVGIEMIDRGIPRTGYKVYRDFVEIGEITTGTQSPTYKKNIGFALVQSEYARIDEEISVEIRNKHIKGKIISTPFYKRNK